MKGYFFEYRIILFQLQTLGGIFPVFGGNVTRSSRNTTVFVFGTLHYYLNAVTFLCHISFEKRSAKVIYFFISTDFKEKKLKSFRKIALGVQVIADFRIGNGYNGAIHSHAAFIQPEARMKFHAGIAESYTQIFKAEWPEPYPLKTGAAFGIS